MIIYPHLI